MASYLMGGRETDRVVRLKLRRPPRFLVEGIPSPFESLTERQRVEARRPLPRVVKRKGGDPV